MLGISQASLSKLGSPGTPAQLPSGRARRQPLREMGADRRAAGLETERVVKAIGPLRGIHYRLPPRKRPGQKRRALAGLYAAGTTSVEEPIPSRDRETVMFAHKVRLNGRGIIRLLIGAKASREDRNSWHQFRSLFGCGAIGRDSDLLLKRRREPTRPESRGVRTCEPPSRSKALESSGEQRRRFEGAVPRLHAIHLAGTVIPRLIDEVPILCIAAAAAEGANEVRDAAELRVKEIDRIVACSANSANWALRRKVTPTESPSTVGPPFTRGISKAAPTTAWR